MRPSASLISILSISIACLSAPVAFAQMGSGGGDYVGVGLGQNVFFSPSGQPFRSNAGQPYPTMNWFNAVDKDHDGKISREEFTEDAMAFFAYLDVNHDGYINSPENTRYEQQVAPEIQRIDPRIKQPSSRYQAPDADMDGSQDKDPTGGKYQKQIIGATQYGLIDEPQPIRAADANFDFRVSSEEWINATNQRFTILDRNEDGFITADELPQTPAQLASFGDKDDKKGKKDKKKHSGLW